MIVKAMDTPVEEVGPGVTRQVLGHDAQLMMVRVAFVKGASGALHAHPHRQVTYVERGRFEATVDGLTTTMSAGDCLFIPPGTVHGVVALDEGALIDAFTPAREEFLP